MYLCQAPVIELLIGRRKPKGQIVQKDWYATMEDSDFGGPVVLSKKESFTDYACNAPGAGGRRLMLPDLVAEARLIRKASKRTRGPLLVDNINTWLRLADDQLTAKALMAVLQDLEDIKLLEKLARARREGELLDREMERKRLTDEELNQIFSQIRR